MKILVVDDETFVLDFYKAALEQHGHAVLTASSGIEGVRRAMADQPDVVLMDLLLPDIDGAEATRRIRRAAGPPVIALTNYPSQENLRRMIEAGARDFIVKSEVSIATLARRIETGQQPRVSQDSPPPKVKEPEPPRPAPPVPALTRDLVEARLKQALELKALPFVAAELIQLTADPHSSADQLAGTIQRDLALTARILKVANSAFYALHGRIQNLTQAITRIGFRGVREIALTMSLIEEFRRPAASEGFDRLEFWRYSLAAATLAKELAASVWREPEAVEQAFLAGLLHDIGKAFLDDHFHAEYAALPAEAAELRVPLHQLERERIRTDHAEVSERLMEKWKLPEALREPVSRHHAPLTKVSADDKTSVVVKIAIVLANATRIGCGGDDTLEEIPDEAVRSAGISPASVQKAVDAVDRQVEELTQILLLHDPGPVSPAPARTPARGDAVLVMPNRPVVEPIGIFLGRLGFRTRYAASVEEALRGAAPAVVWVRGTLDQIPPGQRVRFILACDKKPPKAELKAAGAVAILPPYSMRAIQKAVTRRS
jgi:putative nucleotidyltransferase with HDIG domain